MENEQQTAGDQPLAMKFTSAAFEDQPRLTISYMVPNQHADDFHRELEAEISKVVVTAENHADVTPNAVRAVVAAHPDWGVVIDGDGQPRTSEQPPAGKPRIEIV